MRAADVDAALMAVPDLNPGAGSAFALGVAHQFRLTEAAKHGGEWWVRLTPLGCAAANGSEPPDLRPEFEQTLLVQPNLEVVLYRQGLTPHLLARLTRIAEWRTLGLACTLGLTAESVYRGLESGETLAEVVALLERHGTRAVSETVLGSLRSWASKRERVLVYPAALLLEFVSAAELDRALREGLVEHKVADRIGLIGSEQRIDYGRFRLTGTRDYLAPDERCVELNGDGLTFAVNAHKSDLLLESEARRFAELLPMSGTDDRWRFRMTPETLATARLGGMDVAALNQWFLRRAGGPLSPTAKMLLAGRELPPVRLEQLVVLRAPTAELADGIAAWAETRGYVRERLAPTLLAVPADAVAALQARLAEIGVQFETEAQ